MVSELYHSEYGADFFNKLLSILNCISLLTYAINQTCPNSPNLTDKSNSTKMKLPLSSFLRLPFLCLLLALYACGSTPTAPVEIQTQADPVAASIDELLLNATRSSGSAAAALNIQALEEMLSADMLVRASNQAQAIGELDDLPAELQLRAILVLAEIALRQEQPDVALRWLTGPAGTQIDSRFANQPGLQQDYYLKLGNAYRSSDRYAEAATAYIEFTRLDQPNPNQSIQDQLWDTLNRLDNEVLSDFATTTNSYEARGWIELTRVVRSEQYNIKSQLDSITQWRRIWSQHSASGQLPSSLSKLQQTWEQRPRHIALILPLQDAIGNAIQEGFLSAYYQALGVSREVPRISVYDSSDAASIYPIYDEAVASGADLIIGPLDKELVNQLQQLNELPVPTLALNYADDAGTNSDNLMQFGLAPEDEIRQAASLAWSAGHRNAAIITPQAEDYQRLQNAFSEIWSNMGGNLVSQSTFGGENEYSDVIKRVIAIDSSEARADNLLDLLPRSSMEFTPRRRDDIDFIFLIANPGQGRQIKPTLAFYFAGDIPVYALPSIYDGLNNPSADQDLNGIVFTIEPWVVNSGDPLKIEITASLRPAQGPLQRLRAMGIDSFRLYARLQQLADKEINSLQGATGELSMSESGIIHRKLDVARFVDGIATVSERATNGSD